MFSFITKLRAAYYHSRGLFALDEGRADRAESLLRKAIMCAGRSPNPLLPETYLLLSVAVDRRDGRAEAVELFWTGMAGVEQSRTHSLDDVNYLGTYFCELLQLSDCKPRFERFDITAVSKSLRRAYRMGLAKSYLMR